MYSSVLIVVEIRDWNDFIAHTSSHIIFQNEDLRRKRIWGGGREREREIEVRLLEKVIWKNWYTSKTLLIFKDNLFETYEIKTIKKILKCLQGNSKLYFSLWTLIKFFKMQFKKNTNVYIFRRILKRENKMFESHYVPDWNLTFSLIYFPKNYIIL